MEIKFDFNRYDRIGGVYFIECISTRKMYIGSSVNLITRLECHRSELRGNYHGNRYLQRAFNKYGENNFIIGILEKVDKAEELLNREQYYINKLNPEFNICLDVKRHLFTEESKKLLSEARKKGFIDGTIKPSVMREVNKYDLLGNFLEKYESITEAAKKNGVNISGVERCVYKTAKQCKGLVYRYSDDKTPVTATNKKGWIIECYDTLEDSITIYPSMMQFTKNVGADYATINRIINNGKLYRGRYKIALYKSDKLLEQPEVANQQPIISLND